MLPHFTNVTPAENLEEPLYQNLFEVQFSFPALLGLQEDEENYMLQQTTKINTKATPALTPVTQGFKYSGRVYLNTPKVEDSVNTAISISFNVNVTDQFSVKSWNILKKWYDLAWNTQTGELHYKRDMIGGIIVHIHDREGIVLRRYEYKNVQILSIDEMNFDWSQQSIYTGTATFAADYWVDQYYDLT